MSKGNFHRPADGDIVSWAGPRNFRGRFGGDHFGVDIGALFGWNIRAAFDGVVRTTWIEKVPGTTRPDYRNQAIVIDHPDGSSTGYLHNSANHVRRGDRVRAGQIIGKVGTAGTGPHLHFEYHPDGWYRPSSRQQEATNALLRGTRVDGSSNPSGITVVGSVSAGSNRWPNRPLPLLRPGPGAYWIPPVGFRGVDRVPERFRDALVTALEALGYPLSADTDSARIQQVRQFLRNERGIRVANTWIATVRGLQRFLNGEGLDAGPIDGYWGPQTIWATTAWLRRVRPRITNYLRREL